MLPESYQDENKEGSNYCRFGKIVKKGSRIPQNAVLTKYTWDDKTPVYATPIPSGGWSLTNMMYGKPFEQNGQLKRKLYLCYKARIYTAVRVLPPQKIEVGKESARDLKNLMDLLWVTATSLEHNTNKDNFLAKRDAADGQKLVKELQKKYDVTFAKLGIG